MIVDTIQQIIKKLEVLKVHFLNREGQREEDQKEREKLKDFDIIEGMLRKGESEKLKCSLVYSLVHNFMNQDFKQKQRESIRTKLKEALDRILIKQCGVLNGLKQYLTENQYGKVTEPEFQSGLKYKLQHLQSSSQISSPRPLLPQTFIFSSSQPSNLTTVSSKGKSLLNVSSEKAQCFTLISPFSTHPFPLLLKLSKYRRTVDHPSSSSTLFFGLINKQKILNFSIKQLNQNKDYTGIYFIGNKGFCFNGANSEQNLMQINFKYKEGDLLQVIFERSNGKLRVVNRKSKKEFSLNVGRGKMGIEVLEYCVYTENEGDQQDIVQEMKKILRMND